jgi:eukaryotic-like serine/threonine-protein kinase
MKSKMFDDTQSSFRALRAIFAERTTGIAFWVGSGLSSPAGLPTWPQLKNSLLSVAVSELASHDDERDRRALLSEIEREANHWVAFPVVSG